MSKVSQLLDEDFSFDFERSLHKVKEKRLEKTWGRRDNITRIGKLIEDINLHEKPKRIFSANTQVNLLYDWFKDTRDRRTRRIGKHWLKDIVVERQTILEEYEDWKNAQVFSVEEHRSWSLNFGKLTEQEIKEKHEKEEKKWGGLPDKQIHGLFQDVPDDDFWDFLHNSNAYVDTFENLSDEQREEILKDDKYRLEVIKTVKQKEIEVFGSIFLRFAVASRMLTKYTNNRERQYILTNPVYVKFDDERRLEERVTELHVLFVEIDHYKLDKYKHLTAQEMEKVIFKKLDSVGFPRPTETVYSRGPQLWWKHNPIPEYRIEEWKVAQKFLNDTLSEFNADDSAMDGVRVLRAIGSIHEITGNKIWGVSYTDDRYDFDDLFSRFCLPFWKRMKREKAEARSESNRERNEKFKKEFLDKQDWMLKQGIIDERGIFTDKYEPDRKKKKNKRLNSAAKESPENVIHNRRIDDIFMLSDLRKGDMEGVRRWSLFYVYYLGLCVSGGNNMEAWELMKLLYDGFSWNEFTFAEYQRKSKSAETYYSRWVKDVNKGFNPGTPYLIDKFSITREEMQHLKVLVDDKEKKRRKSIYNKGYYEANKGYYLDYFKNYYKRQREAEGKLSVEKKKSVRIAEIKATLTLTPTLSNRQLAKLVGVSEGTIRNDLKCITN